MTVRSSSIKDYRVVSNGKVYHVEWRWRTPRWYQAAQWQTLSKPGLYHSHPFESSSLHDACVEMDNRISEDDPPPFIEVECDET